MLQKKKFCVLPIVNNSKFSNIRWKLAKRLRIFILQTWKERQEKKTTNTHVTISNNTANNVKKTIYNRKRAKKREALLYWPANMLNNNEIAFYWNGIEWILCVYLVDVRCAAQIRTLITHEYTQTDLSVAPERVCEKKRHRHSNTHKILVCKEKKIGRKEYGTFRFFYLNSEFSVNLVSSIVIETHNHTDTVLSSSISCFSFFRLNKAVAWL